jgi:ABC-type branched-subunit amino acid transport system substrate-binding protein
VLLSTGSGLSRKVLRQAGRYVQGALLAPGYFADEKDPVASAFFAAHRTAYGQEPGVSEAFGYDAVKLLRLAVERGARTRADLVRVLGSETFPGVTGAMRFAADRGRADLPLVYVVDGDDIRLVR